MVQAVQASLFVQTAKPIHWLLMLVSDKLDWSVVHTWTQQAWAVSSALWGVRKAAHKRREQSAADASGKHQYRTFDANGDGDSYGSLVDRAHPAVL